MTFVRKRLNYAIKNLKLDYERMCKMKENYGYTHSL